MLNQFFGEEYSKKIGQFIVVTLGLLSLFLLVKVFADLKRLPRAGNEVYPQSTIMVSGEGEAYAIPDIASFNFTVTETSESVQSAQEAMNTKVNAALSSLKSFGVDEKDIKTISYNVYPKYEWNQPPCVYGMSCPSGKSELVGYEASQTILVKVRDTKKAGDLVGAIGALKISNVSGLDFTVDNKDEFIAQARAEAIKKAKEQAKTMAKQLGVKLGKVMYINEQGNYMPMYYGGAYMEKDMGMGGANQASLPVGENRITSQVTITYEIK